MQAGSHKGGPGTRSGPLLAITAGQAHVTDFANPLGGTLVVWRLDRLGRSLPHLIETVSQLQQQGVGFRSLQEQIDTTTSGGKLVFHVFGALAEFERDLIRERTHAGLAAARKRGRLFGRPKVLSPRKITQLRTLAKDERTTEGGRQSRVS